MDKALINKRVLEAINYVITQFKITKTALADVFDVKPAKFSEILKERMNAGVDIMAVLCDTYNISAEWLLTGEGSMLKTTPPPETSSDSPETPSDTADKNKMLDTIVTQAHIIERQQLKIESLEHRLAQNEA